MVSTTQLSYAPSLHSFLIKYQHHSTVICPPSLHFSLKGQHHSTVICPLYPLLPQSSATLHCQIPHSSPFSINCQHHSTVICRPISPSLSKVSITQLSYGPQLPPSQSKVSNTQLSYTPSAPFSPEGQHHSTVICPPLPTSQSMVSTTQLSYAPSLHSFLIKYQHHSTVICPPSLHFSLKGQHHSTVICPLYPLLPQSSATLHCQIPHSSPFSIKA